MVYFTVQNTSGGNHGHQLKDLLGGITIGRIFDFEYVHTCYPYLDFFGLGLNELTVGEIDEKIDRLRFSGPFWRGMNLADAQDTFGRIKAKYSDRSCLVTLENALRIHPCQTVRWFREGLIRTDVFGEVLGEATRKYEAKHIERETHFDKDTFNVAIHINRGADYDPVKFPKHFSSHENVRFMFPISYYTRIMDQLRHTLAGRRIQFHIYTEKLNSEEIVTAFGNTNDVILHVGQNRSENNNQLAHEIFDHFVKSDVLVACNSSFSAMASYFRNNRITIYHPHADLFDLPGDRFLATDPEGNFDTSALNVTSPLLKALNGGPLS